MNSVITLLLIPFTLGRQQMVSILWLEATTLDELATIGSVGLVGVILSGKDDLDRMIPLIASALNPDSLRLIYRWYSHRFPLV
jgi:hypothetical protein